jgi:hypothetical protein
LNLTVGFWWAMARQKTLPFFASAIAITIIVNKATIPFYGA